jgi:predicted small secreted protein
MNRTLILLTTLAAALILGACNTTAGAGKDLKSAGKAIEKTAEDAK